VGALGRVYWWGTNQHGQPGLPVSKPSSAYPTEVASAPKAVRVTCGNQHTCIIAKDGGVYCWGRNDKGQLGNGKTATKSPNVTAVNKP